MRTPIKVFILAGQSNMELPVRRTLDADSEIASATQPKIRLFTVPKAAAVSPQSDFPASVAWHTAAPDTVARPAPDSIVTWAMPPRTRRQRAFEPGQLAAQRHYLPANVPLLKRVAAMGGDEVCALGQEIFVNGRWIGERRGFDRQGRPLPWWSGCERLRGGRLFLLMNVPDSFDGRYFGPVDDTAIIGKATPLWLR